MRAVGLVLAAGAGTRFGGPKGLARTADGEPWVARAVRALQDGGCRDVLVAVGAEADAVAALVPAGAGTVRVADGADGLAATLRAGLAASVSQGADVVVIVPVDTPDLPADAVARVLDAVRGAPRAGLAQAVHGGRPGHPVAVGADHIDAVISTLVGDRGARAYLAAHAAIEVECGDLWSGADVDRRP